MDSIGTGKGLAHTTGWPTWVSSSVFPRIWILSKWQSANSGRTRIQWLNGCGGSTVNASV